MRKIVMILLLGSALFCTGCFHDDDDNPIVMNNPQPVNDGDMDSTDFTAFTKNLLLMTADNTAPVEIDSLAFSFDEDEQAFDDIL